MATKSLIDRPGAQRWVPLDSDLPGLAAAARSCRGCELYEHATQTVFGAGSPTARIVLVGEQPGDAEDRRGAPFVGPAGRLLDAALEEAGIDRSEAYVTNAVKHFRFSQSGPGKRRIHQAPDLAHISACRPWLTAELEILDPEVVVCLGATAGRALLGPSFRVTKQRGLLLPWEGVHSEDDERESEPSNRRHVRGSRDEQGATMRTEEAARHRRYIVATVHPSAVLRATDRDAAYAGLVADLRVAAEV